MIVIVNQLRSWFSSLWLAIAGWNIQMGYLSLMITNTTTVKTNPSQTVILFSISRVKLT